METYWLALLLALSLLISAPAALAGDVVPSAGIPLLEKKVSLDGTWNAEDWSDAAVVRRIQDMGNTKLSDPPTEFHLKYDTEALYVAVVCYEREEGYPQASKRDPRDTLITNDDAVQVVLGAADENTPVREVLNMGGYQGAMGGQTTAADHYYQFTVNAAGSQARTYNESPLRRPMFQARVGKSEGTWIAQMRIPFSSCGLSVRAGQTIYANLFRYRPPLMTGWHLPAFGGYCAMPLGTFTLLAKGENAKRTIETRPERAAAAVVSKTPTWRGEIGYYPLSGSIVGVINQGMPVPGTKAVVTVSGLAEKTLLLSADSRQLVVIDIPKGSQPARQAELKIVDKAGKVLFETKRDLPAVKAPEWVGTRAGIEYVDRKIPRPWTKPVVNANKIQLVDKTLRFGSLGLLESIEDKLGELLAGQGQIIVEAKGQPLVFKSTGEIVSTQGLGATVVARAASGNGVLETRSDVDYDGFIVVKIRLTGIRPQDISRLAFRIPIKRENAKFLHKVLVQEIGELTGCGYQMQSGPLWVGNHDKGLAFTFDTDPFVSRRLRSQVRVIEEKDATWMEMNFVDGVGQVKDDGHIFRFFLQPTPTKPVTLKKVHPFVQWQWEGWSDYQGYPDLAKMDKLKKWSDDIHKQNQIGLLYTCQGLAEDSPGFGEFRDDLTALPPWIFYRRAFDPGRGVPGYHCCKRGPEGDLQLWAFEKLHREAGIDGLVSDGLSLAWVCENPGHADGCGRPVKLEWERDSLTRVTAQRQFLKRMRGIFSDGGRPFYMTAHCGGGLEINTLSFFDGYMEGEQLARFRPGYQIPPATIAVGYSGRPWGFRTIFWEKTWRRTRGFSWSLAYAMLNDLELEDSPVANEIYSKFEDDRETTYYPHWRPQPHVTLRSGHSQVSYYRKSDEALVVVGNLEFEDDQIELNLEKLFPGRTIDVCELLTGRSIQAENGIVKGPLASYGCLVLRVVPLKASEAAGSAAQFSLTEYRKKDWAVNPSLPGVNFDYRADVDGKTGMAMSSAAYQAWPEAALGERPLGRNGTIALRVKIVNRFVLRIGPVNILHDGGWKFEGPTAVWNRGIVSDVKVDPTKYVDLTVTLNDGTIDATLDGTPLIRDMASDLPLRGNIIRLATWGGDAVQFTVQEVSTSPRKLFAGKVESFTVKGWNADDWRVNSDAPGVKMEADGANTLVLKSTANQAAAVAELKGRTIGRSGTIALKVTLTSRLRLNIGPVTLLHDYDWQMHGPLNGWNVGTLNQIPVLADKSCVLVLTIRDGVFDAVLGDTPLVRNMRFDLPESGNKISIETWAGDSVRMEVIEVSTTPKALFGEGIRHPVL